MKALCSRQLVALATVALVWSSARAVSAQQFDSRIPPEPQFPFSSVNINDAPTLNEYQHLMQRLDQQEAEIRALRNQTQSGPFMPTGRMRIDGQPISDGPTSPVSAADAAASVSAADAIDPAIKIKKVAIVDKPAPRLFGRIIWDGAWFDQSASNMATPGIGDIQDGLDFRQARLGAIGTLYENIEYKVEMDFAASGRPSFQDDVYINVGLLPVLQNVKVGHYKEPFSLEQITSTLNLTFMERSLADCFSPSRTDGVSTWGYADTLNWTYAIGVFRTKTDEFGGGVADDGDHSLTMRYTWLPYYDEPSEGRYLFHVGGAFSYRRTLNHVAAFSSRPEIFMQADTAANGDNGAAGKVPAFVNTGNIASDQFQEFGIEALWINGPLSIQSEVMLVPVQQNNAANPDLFFPGAYVYVSYFLTGENRGYNRQRGIMDRVVPYENFFRVRTADGVCCGKGAWELAARWSYIDLNDQNILGGREQNTTLGVNWYLNPNTRMMFNWIHADLDRANIESFADIFGVRFQVDF